MENHRRKALQGLWPLLFLIVLNWVIRYWQSNLFGFYEDDHQFVLRAIEMTGGEFRKYIFNIGDIIRFIDAGHPLHPRFITIATKIGWWLGNLQGLYWVSFLIGLINISLFYFLMKRLHSVALGAIAGTIYVLYFADTTQAYLTFAFGLQPSIMLLLLAAHLYLSGNRWIPYLLSILILFTYETVFPIFLAIPLLAGFYKKKYRTLLRHIGISTLIFIGIVLWRALVGENRLGQLSVLDAIRIPLLHMLQGPIVSLGTYLYRPVQTLQSITPDMLPAYFLVVISLSLLIFKLRPSGIIIEKPKHGTNLSRHANLKGRISWLRQAYVGLNQEAKSLFPLAMTGGIMLILAYPLTFTVRAFAISGRDTRVHAAGVIGAAILLGSTLLLVVTLARNIRRGQVLLIMTGIWLGTLAMFGFIVQRDYVVAWQYQRDFWSSMIPFIPDLEEGTMIIIDPGGIKDTKYIAANTWSLRNVLGSLVEFPSEWETVPHVHRLLPDWKERALSNSVEIKVLDYEWEYVEIPWSSAILLETENGVVVQREETLIVDGIEHELKHFDNSVTPQYLKSDIYQYFID